MWSKQQDKEGRGWGCWLELWRAISSCSRNKHEVQSIASEGGECREQGVEDRGGANGFATQDDERQSELGFVSRMKNESQAGRLWVKLGSKV